MRIRNYNVVMAGTTDITFEIHGITLHGVLHTPSFTPSVCVVISHGFAGYGDSPKWTMLAAGLARQGIPCLRFSHRGCGTSGGDFSDTTLTSRVDELRAAMDMVSDRLGVRALGLAGSSFGGVTALMCADDPRVRCSAIMGTPADFDFFSIMFPNNDPQKDELLEVDGRTVKSGIFLDVKNYDVEAAAARTQRLLVMHGSKDDLLPSSHAERLFAAAPEPKELHIVPDADHPFSEERHQLLLFENVFRWFHKHLAP